jgi:aspartyl-tRNA(Asn)/glutamyl-tRNA(Gln) amidotransferase subunit C
MALDKEKVREIAFLARIKVPDEALEPLAGELSQILEWVEQLDEVDTGGVEPIYSVAQMEIYKRKDVVNDGDVRDKVLANAPDAEGGFYTVPKVVE